VTSKTSLGFYVVALLSQGATTATSLTVQQHTYHDADQNASRASAHTQVIQASQVDCPAWYDTSKYEYPFYYQDDPSVDDFPTTSSSYVDGFTSGVSRFIGLAQLRALPTDLGAQICIVEYPNCRAHCVDASQLVTQGTAATCSDLAGMNEVQKSIALMAGACGSEVSEGDSNAWFATSGAGQFYQGGFYNTPGDLEQGSVASGTESYAWASEECGARGDKSVFNYGPVAGEPNFHVWCWGMDFRPISTTVELGFHGTGGSGNIPRTSGNQYSIMEHVGHMKIMFARVTKASGASATGDPHLQNIHGERFDLMRPGMSVLINIPRGTAAEDALLVVRANARHAGQQCSDMYFQELNVTGAWADAAQPGGFRFDAHDALDRKPTWMKLGPVGLKIVHGHTDMGIQYLNIFVKHLGRAGFPVGGLLGEDDHAEAAKPEAACQRTTSLSQGNQKASSASVANVYS